MTELSHSFRPLALVALLAAAPDVARGEMLLQRPPREIAFRLDIARGDRVDLLLPLRDASIDHLGPVRLYTSGPWGQWQREPLLRLEWPSASNAADHGPMLSLSDDTVQLESDSDPPTTNDLEAPRWLSTTFEDDLRAPLELPGLFAVRGRGWASRYSAAAPPAFDTTGFSLHTDGFDSIFRLPPENPVIDWRCRRSPVLVSRTGGESDRFALVRCDGSTAPEALDRLSILARPPEVQRLAGLLPDEPDPASWAAKREWTPGVRVLHPRLVWALQQIADAFPHRAIILYSGYRPLAEVNDSVGHKSLHASGRALDIAVHRVENDDLFRVCSKLRGVGCGFYPHNKFVHLDVRRAGPGEAFWVDGSLPGEPAKYESDYPGLVERGKLVKVGKPAKPSQ